MLYKFRSDGRAIQTVKRGVFWAASAASFNDPFDCKTLILGDVYAQDAVDEARNLSELSELLILAADGRAVIPGVSLEDGRRFLSTLEKASNHEAKMGVFDQFMSRFHPSQQPLRSSDAIAILEAKLATVGIVSLAARWDSLLMWSHYADSHRGFCLAFDRDEFCANSVCGPVTYCTSLPQVNLHEIEVLRAVHHSPETQSGLRARDYATVPINDSRLLAVIYSKFAHWSYEEEWRMLLLDADSEVPYPCPLREIIFGMRCPESTRLAVVSAVRTAAQQNSWREVRFRETIASKTHFALDIRDWTPPVSSAA